MTKTTGMLLYRIQDGGAAVKAVHEYTIRD